MGLGGGDRWIEVIAVVMIAYSKQKVNRYGKATLADFFVICVIFYLPWLQSLDLFSHHVIIILATRHSR